MMPPFKDHLKHVLVASSFIEEFTVHPADGGDPFVIRGIFDESVLTEDGKRMTRPCPRIMLFEIPEYESGKTEIIVRGKTYRAQKHEIDANTGAVLFLI
jgi:hypothetical protein